MSCLHLLPTSRIHCTCKFSIQMLYIHNCNMHCRSHINKLFTHVCRDVIGCTITGSGKTLTLPSPFVQVLSRIGDTIFQKKSIHLFRHHYNPKLICTWCTVEPSIALGNSYIGLAFIEGLFCTRSFGTCMGSWPLYRGGLYSGVAVKRGSTIELLYNYNNYILYCELACKFITLTFSTITPAQSGHT